MPQPYSHNLTTNHIDGINEVIHASDIDALAIHVNQLEVDANAAGPLDLPGHIVTGHGGGGGLWIPGTLPYSVGPFPQDDSGWAREVFAGTLGGVNAIPRAPALTTYAINNQLHLPGSVAACRESPPTSFQAQVNATAANGVLRLTPGYIYREAVTISNPITIVGLGLSSLRGSDDWSPGGVSGCTWNPTAGIYASSLTIPAMALDSVQGSPTNSFAQQHRETVFLDGIALQIANTASPSASQFALDGSRHVLLGLNPVGHKVEVSTRSTVITSTANNAFMLDGLDIRHIASSGVGQPTAIDLSTISTANITLLNCMVGWCHGGGLNVGGKTNLLVENCIVHDCGTSGIAGSSNTNPLYRRSIFFNNGLAVYGWDPYYGSGGIKEAGSTGGMMDECIAFSNISCGLWYDVVCTRSGFRDCVAWDNRPNNYSYEVSSFGVIRDNVSFRTPNMRGGLNSLDFGIAVNNSRWTEIYGNLMMNTPINFGFRWAPSRTDSPPSNTQDNTHMGGVNLHDNTIIGRYHAADQGGVSDIGNQWADDGTGSYVNTSTNVGRNNQFGWPAIINSGAGFLETQQEPDSRWWHDGGGGNLQVTTIASWSALQFGQSSSYMLDATRVGHLRRFGLLP